MKRLAIVEWIDTSECSLGTPYGVHDGCYWKVHQLILPGSRVDLSDYLDPAKTSTEVRNYRTATTADRVESLP